MNRDLSLQQLRCLVAVADTLHFGEAADVCEVSQPALSAQISKLEDTLGVQLVERTTRRVMLTRHGEAVVAHARRVTDGVDLIVESTRARKPLTGPLRLGVIPTIAPYLLPPMLAKVRKQHPDLQLLLHEDQTARLVDALHRGQIDVALLALPVTTTGIDEHEIGIEPFVLVVPSHHRLANRKQVLNLDLAGEEALLLGDGHCLRDQALEVCHIAGASETGTIRANSITTLVQMVANGLGVTLLPQSAVKSELRGMRDVVAVPFKGPAPSRTIGLISRKSSGHDEDIDLLRKLVAAQL